MKTTSVTKKKETEFRTSIDVFLRFAHTQRKNGSRGTNKNNYGIRRYWSASKSKSDKAPNKCRGPIALTVETSCFESHRMIRRATVPSTNTAAECVVLES